MRPPSKPRADGPNVMRRIIAALSVVSGLAVFGASPCITAQEYPSKPVRIVVSFAPGGPADIIGRLVAQRLSEHFGQSFVVENRGGAGGNNAAKFVAGASPDGYTLLVTTSALAVNQTLYKDPGYQAPRDFTPIALVASSPNVLVTSPSTPANNLSEFIRDNKGNSVSYASAGIGSTPHLTGDHVLRVLAGLDAVHIPYQGAAPAIAAAMGNHVTLASVALPPAVADIKAGKLKGLAVTSLERVGALPDVPTVAESGFPGFEDYTWVGLFGPANLAPSIARRLNAAIDDALRSSEVRDNLAAMGFEAKPGTQAEFDAYLRAELAKWGKIVKDTGITAQ
jgi:tripartite-type tricarboxylate transporter receptor subunit TctC